MEIRGAGALVTGGASGLGLATARRLARTGARVTIVRHTAEQIGSAAAGSGDLEAQIALYEAGLGSGDFVFHVPDTPVIDNEDLDVEDLNAVSAGTTYCCCCCPACSSCTI